MSANVHILSSMWMHPRFDEWMKGGIVDTSWNSFWQAASRRTPGGFTLEVFLPYSLFSDRTVWNGNWRRNVIRNDKGGLRSPEEVARPPLASRRVVRFQRFASCSGGFSPPRTN